MSRKAKDNLVRGAIYGCAGFTVLILVVIIGFIVIKGLPGISIDFLTRDYEDKTTYISVDAAEQEQTSGQEEGYVSSIKAVIGLNDKGQAVITKLDEDYPL